MQCCRSWVGDFKFEISDFKSHTRGMTYERFEDLPVWQKAAELYEATEELLEHRGFTATREFGDQLDRAALSVSNNVAEGFERGTTNELLTFIYIARGSAGEIRSMLCPKGRRAKKANWSVDLRSEISNLKLIVISCSKQLRAWADHLQNSVIKGQWHLSDRFRRESDQKKRAAAFNEEFLHNCSRIIRCAWQSKSERI
jgi:four helix bundle protein